MPKIEITMEPDRYEEFTDSLESWEERETFHMPYNVHEIINVEFYTKKVCIETNPMKPLGLALWQRFHASKANPENRSRILKQHRKFVQMNPRYIDEDIGYMFGIDQDRLDIQIARDNARIAKQEAAKATRSARTSCPESASS